MLIASACGILMIVAWFVPATQSLADDVTDFFNILAAVAFVLGAGNLMRANLRKISDRAPGWGYGAITLAAFLITLVVGLGKVGVHPSPLAPDQAWSGSYIEEGSAFWWMFEYLMRPLVATMFAMLAFYVASAAFRAFRAKNVEAVLLLVTAFIVLLGRTFAGTLLTSWLPEALQFDQLTLVIMKVFNTAGTRAIMIGVALGTAAVSLRVLLGIDRSWMGSEERSRS